MAHSYRITKSYLKHGWLFNPALEAKSYFLLILWTRIATYYKLVFESSLHIAPSIKMVPDVNSWVEFCTVIPRILQYEFLHKYFKKSLGLSTTFLGMVTPVNKNFLSFAVISVIVSNLNFSTIENFLHLQFFLWSVIKFCSISCTET